MRRALGLTVLAFAVAACAIGARWERPGGTDTERQRDETECASLANRDHSVPSQRITMRSDGSTTETTGLVTVRDFDTSAFDACMRGRGYARVPARPPS